MSNRSRDQFYTLKADDRQSLSKASKPKGKKRITGTPGQRSNGFRLSDIGKLIHGRHKGPCEDPKWWRIYFRAALPHIIADTGRLIAAKGSYIDAVRAWAIEWVPLLIIFEGDRWIEREVTAYLAKPRSRCPRIDRTNRLLRIEDHEPEAYGLCSLSAMSRPKKVRKVQRAAKAVERSQRNRAKVPGYTPRSESLEQTKPWKAEGISRTEWYARRKGGEAASVPVLGEPCHVEAEPLDSFVRTDSDHLDSFVRNRSNGVSGQFRSQHLEYTETPLTGLQNEAPADQPGEDLRATLDAWERLRSIPFAPAVTTGAKQGDRWHAYERQPLPTSDEHAATMAALRAKARAARAEWGQLQSEQDGLHLDGDQLDAFHPTVAAA